MAGVGEKAGAVASIPHLHGLIVTGRGEPLDIGGPRYTLYSSSMAGVGKSCLSATEFSIPYPYGLIPACRGEALTIGGPRYAEHPISMPTVGEQGVPATSIPHPYDIISAG